jgi:hypothetical protein
MWQLVSHRGGRCVAATFVVASLLGVTGCAQIPGIAPEFNAGQNTLTSYPAGQPMAIDPGTAEADQGAVGSVARPAVMVEERTVPATTTARVAAPQNLAPPTRSASAEPEPLPLPSRGTPNLAAPAEQPKSKLLTPDEKAKVIAELEALAKSQSAQLRKSKSDCANETVPPGKRVASAGGEC